MESDFCLDVGEEVAWRLENILEAKFVAFKKGKPQLSVKNRAEL